MTPATTVSNMLEPTAGNLRGRATGALICGAFGAVWIFEAVYWGGIATPVSVALAGLLAAAFVLWPVAQLWSLRRLRSSPASASAWSQAAPKYWTIVVLEWLTATVGARWLVDMHRADLVPQFVAMVVGLHFWPLAKIFHARIYYWTGAVMLLGAIASLAIPAGNVRNLVVCGAAGYALWATAVVILCQDKFALRRQSTCGGF